MYPIFPGVNAWNIANSAPAVKRAISIGYLVCVGNIGGVIGSYIYKEKEAPKYETGFGSSLAFAAAGLISALSIAFFLWKINARNEKIPEEEVREKYTEEELERLGEKSPLFKYSL